MGKLTVLKIRNISKPGLYGDGRRLYLEARAGTRGLTKSWIYRYPGPNGKSRYHGLGSLEDVTLSEAREEAEKVRVGLRNGIDPIDQKKVARAEAQVAAAKAMTFAQCADAYIAAHRDDWTSAKHAAQWETTVKTYVHPIIGRLPVAEIDTAAVLRVLQPIWTTKNETASRVRSRIENILGWATASGYRSGDNPARWTAHLKTLLPACNTAVNLAALPYNELPAFMATLRAQQGVPARALEFLILTASRTNEVLGARWDEIGKVEKVDAWTVPAERMKGRKGKRREHVVPLSNRALKILEEMQAIKDNDFIFPGTRGGGCGHSALLDCLKLIRSGVTTHGFRSSFRDWVGDRTKFQRETAEAALAHKIGDAAEQAYRRKTAIEKRRNLMQAWADYCGPRRVQPAGEVVQLREAV